MGTIARSIRKTHRAIIVEECMRTGGIGATLRASIMEHLFDELDGPVICLSSQDVPTPYSGLLEDMTVVQPGQIVQAVKSMCSTDSFRQFLRFYFSFSFSSAMRSSSSSFSLSLRFARSCQKEKE